MGEWACYPTTSRRIGHIKINDSVNLRPTQPNLSPQHPSLPHRLTPWAYPCPTGDLPRGSHSGAEREAPASSPGRSGKSSGGGGGADFQTPKIPVSQEPRTGVPMHTLTDSRRKMSPGERAGERGRIYFETITTPVIVL